MAEQLNQSHSERINNVELAHLGALMVEAGRRSDLGAIGEQHVAATGLENPNSVGETAFAVGNPDVPMTNDNVYRQAGVEALEDLAASGIVRNGATAQGTQHRRWGHRVFWHPGEEGKALATGGRTVIEADKQTAGSGWVTADKVRGAYVQDSDGRVKNIIPPQPS